MDYNYTDVVQNLGGMMFEADNEFIENHGISFQYITNGYVDLINYCGANIFNSDSDGFEVYIEERDEYLSQQEFQYYILNKTKKIIGRIHKVLNSVSGDENYDDSLRLTESEHEDFIQAINNTKTERWEEDGTGNTLCSACSYIAKRKTSRCPECGANMIGELVN